MSPTYAVIAAVLGLVIVNNKPLLKYLDTFRTNPIERPGARPVVKTQYVFDISTVAGKQEKLTLSKESTEQLLKGLNDQMGESLDYRLKEARPR